MLDRRDYLLRQLQQFIDAIIMKFTSIELEEKLYDPEEIGDLYRKYLQENRQFFIDSSTAEIIDFLQQNTLPENALAKMEILAELLYGEGKILRDTTLIKKAVELLEYNLKKSGVFDMQKMKRLKEMKEII